jgi:hypothetical protein
LRRAARSLLVGLAGLVAAWPTLPQARAADPSLPLLTEPQQRLFEATTDEKPYNVRLHFLKSNERRHDLFFSSLRGLGGGYLGVGADQNYTLAAVARAELMWLVDIDGDVVQWHKIYAALIPVAPAPADLLALLSGRRDAEVKAALAARWGDVATTLWPTFLRYRGSLLVHLTAERTVQRRGKPVTWIGDPALYQHVRSLMLARRVIPRVGDLHGETTLLGIAQTARQAGIPLRTVYLSNAEQWFRYSPQFQRNMMALPHEPGTLVLRTIARGELPTPDLDRWHFSVQTLDEFLQRMADTQRPARKVGDLLPDMLASRRPGSLGLSWLGAVQPPRTPLVLRELPPVRPADPELSPSPPPPPPSPPPSLVAWSALPPLRPADAVLATSRPRPPRDWTQLPSLRLADLRPPAASIPAAPRDPSRLPPLRLPDPPPAAPPPAPGGAVLPPLRLATPPSAARAPIDWRRLPPLRLADTSLASAAPGLTPPARPRDLAASALPPLRDGTGGTGPRP